MKIRRTIGSRARYPAPIYGSESLCERFPPRSTKRVLQAAVAAGALVAATAPAAMANWVSDGNAMIGWTETDGKSRNWDDQGHYSQIKWRDCEVQDYGQAQKADIRLWRDVTFPADNVNQGTMTYTACFKDNTTKSIGEWTNLPAGTHSYFYKTPSVGTSSAPGGLLHVDWVAVDTSLAD